MSTYKGIRGLTIRTVDGDHSPLITGDIWYNSVAKKIRGAKLVAAWASGGNMNNARSRRSGSAGTQTTALVHGGNSGTVEAYNESYDGSSWTEVADLPAKGYVGVGFGTSTASLVTAGINLSNSPSDTTIEWNGTGWSAGGDLASGARNYGAGAGLQTAGLIFGGAPPPKAYVESYNGSTWTEIADINTGRAGLAGLGTQAAALAVGGSAQALVESWNGTSWTEVGDLNTGIRGCSCSGTATAGLASGGGVYTASSALTESWDGSSWTEVGDLATARQSSGSSPQGTSSLALMSGGGTGSQGESGLTGATEEWEVGASVQTVAFD